MKLYQIEKRIPQTLTNSKDVIQKGREHARRSSRARSTRGQENEAWALYKKNPSRVSWVDLSRDRYIALPKVATPAGNTFARRLLFTWEKHHSPKQTTCSGAELYSEEPEVGWRSTKSQKKLVDYANTTNVEFIIDPKVLFHGWLIYSYLQIFKLIKCKWLPGECADWYFDNILTWSYCLHRQYSMAR